MNGDAGGRFAILIPVYNHAEGIGPVVERAGSINGQSAVIRTTTSA